MKKPLSTTPTARKLTDRECCAVIGGLLGGLIRVSNVSDVRAAIEWWANTPEAWTAFVAMAEQGDAFVNEAMRVANDGSN